MADQIGVAIVDNDIVLSTGLGGSAFVGETGSLTTSEIVTADNADTVLGFSTTIQTLKTHANYAGSAWTSKTYAITTTDATLTAIATITVPVDSAIAIKSFTIGRRGDDTASLADHYIFTAYNDSGTLVAGTHDQIGASVAGTVGAIQTGFSGEDVTDTVSALVKGEAATTWYWVVQVDYIILATSA